MVRRWFFGIAFVLVALIAATAYLWPPALWSLAFVGPLIMLGIRDSLQTRHTVLRNFPVVGHGRYLFESIRPEIQQYFVETNLDAFPIEREFRNIAYTRAKGGLETVPFGTQRDVYRIGYEWASHSFAPVDKLEEEPRLMVGGPRCSQPYASSRLNISAMSFGAISSHAVIALNRGARAGGFAHNTGEGGLSEHHLAGGGDLIWQIGTGYFGCRTRDGGFDAARFADAAAQPAVRMIELKLSQGAKPGGGGILPGPKVSPEIAQARGIPIGETCISPAYHRAFGTPREMIEFVVRLRELAQGKPIGIKLCVGRRTDFFALCKAMVDTGHAPDFITVDGGEGGTGAAPLEFSNSLGMPARDAIVFVHNALVGAGLRQDIRLFASGKMFTGFHLIRALALGADGCNSARGMMFALGCIQALRCNRNTCPTGITTQNPALVHGLHVPSKAERVQRFHHGTIRSMLELLAAMGLDDPGQVRPHHVFRRVDDMRIRSFAEIYDFLESRQLRDDDGVPGELREDWAAADPDRWSMQPEKGLGTHQRRRP
jgi:glutamate synthase domain-containing protein 2